MAYQKIVHEWSPWERKYSLLGEPLAWARRWCVRVGDECFATQSQRIPSLGELEAMTRSERRKWNRGTWQG